MNAQEVLDYVKNMLGYPEVDIEITDDSISKCSNQAILVAKDHMQVKRYKTYTVNRTTSDLITRASYKVDLSELEFDVVTNVFRGDYLSPYLFDSFYFVNYAARGVPASYAVAINMLSNLEALLNRSWKVVGKSLFLDKFYGAVTVEFVPSIIGIEDIDDSFWKQWILKYTLALCKEKLGRVRGKVKVDSDPVTLDSDQLLQEANDEKVKLEEEIKDMGLLRITR